MGLLPSGAQDHHGQKVSSIDRNDLILSSLTLKEKVHHQRAREASALGLAADLHAQNHVTIVCAAPLA